jgi:sugar lactone lactonase YvrE
VKILKTTVLAEGFFLLEAPRWHAGTLWMSDAAGGKVYCLDLGGKAKIVAEVPERPFGIGFLPDGTPIVASILDRQILRLEKDRLLSHADLRQVTVGNLYDMIVDHLGRAYVGSFNYEVSAPECFRTACITLVTAKGKARVVADNLARPNGIAITGDRQLLVAETLGNRLTAFQIAADGSLSRRRLFASFEQISPDGICLDAEGAVWTAAAHQPLFVRVFQGGRITHRVHVPGRQAVACQLGGSDGQTLFCLTLAKNLENYPNRSATARVETTQVDVPSARPT